MCKEIKIVKILPPLFLNSGTKNIGNRFHEPSLTLEEFGEASSFTCLSAMKMFTTACPVPFEWRRISVCYTYILEVCFLHSINVLYQYTHTPPSSEIRKVPKMSAFYWDFHFIFQIFSLNTLDSRFRDHLRNMRFPLLPAPLSWPLENSVY